MDESVIALFSDHVTEILPPEQGGRCADGLVCLCCCRPRPSTRMDEDGCGICDECLAP